MAIRIPGVPALSVPAAVAAVELLVADAIQILLGDNGGPQWGVFLAGAEALPINSVLRFDYRQDWQIADYPVEQGAFQSYDKVQLPFDLRLKITSGGSIADRQEMLAAVKQVANSIELYDILTPEEAYTSVNCMHFDFNRQAMSGLGMLIIDIWFQEIRETGTAAFSNTQKPAEAGVQNIGTVQPQQVPSGTFAPNLSFF